MKMCPIDYGREINIKPHLFEYLGSYKEFPLFMNNEGLKKNGYDINAYLSY